MTLTQTLSIVAGALVIGAYALIPTHHQVTELQVTTEAGELWIIGVGDTCRDALKDHGPIPQDWAEIRCVTR